MSADLPGGPGSDGAPRPWSGTGPAASADPVAPVAPAGQRCSVLSRAGTEPVEATAPHAVSWLGLVVPGAWARDTATRLPSDLRTALAAHPLVRAVLLRPVGRETSSVGLVLAGTRPGSAWLRQVGVDDVAETVAALADASTGLLERLSRGEDPGLGRAETRPAVLVCTNGARDACCALEGRPAAAFLAERLRGRPAGLLRRGSGADVWESSHLGGHRFAPTLAVLPAGVLLGGLGPDPEALADAVEDLLAGRPVLDGYRGRSTFTAAEQAAETAVRRHLALVGISAGPDDIRVDGSTTGPFPPDQDLLHDDVDPAPEPDPAEAGVTRVLVRHTGGRTFRVVVRRVETDEVRPASCGAAPSPVVVWEAEVDPDTAPGFYFGG